MLSETARLRCPASVAARVLDGEAVMIHLESGRYYSAEGLAAVLWQFLDSGVPLGEIVAEMTRHFALPPAQAREDVDRFVTELVREELLVPEPDAAGPDASAAGVKFETTQYTAPVLHAYRDMADLLALDPPMPSLKPIR